MIRKFILLISFVLPLILLAQSPGGVTTDLSIWYKADNGVTTNATKLVTQWNSSSATNVVLTPNGTVVLPYNDQTTYTSTWNFNPTVTFNGTNNYLRNNATAYLTSTGSVHYIVVAKGTNRSTAPRSLFAILGNDDGFFYSGDGGNTAFPTIGNNYNSAAAAITSPDDFGIYSAILPKTIPQGIQRGYYNGLRKNYPSPYPIGGATYNLPTLGAYMGADGTTGDNFFGDIAEVIIYHSPIGNDILDADLERIHSYLAVKYGITLTSTQNYLSSSSQIVWNATSNLDYANNIFGIARDDNGTLHQKQSKSANLNQKLIIGNGSSLFNTNAANTNTLTDRQFLLVGDNGLKQSLTTPLSYTSGSNGETNFRFESVWKVQNTNSVGTVTVAWPKGIQNLYLVQSGDETFTSGDTFTPMTTEVTLNGVVYNTATVTLGDGQFFTFAGFEYAPGGVTGSDFWVKSDDAGTIATAWKDHSANADNIPNEGGITLSPADRAHNFHPYTTGYSATKYFYNTNSVLNTTNVFTDPSMRSSVSVFSAVRPTATNGTGRITGIDDDANASEPGISINSGRPHIYKYYGNGGVQANSNTMSAANAFTVNKNSVFSAIQDQALNSGRGERRLGLDGTYEAFNLGSTTNTFNVLGRHLKIGYAGWDSPGAFPGDIMEVVWYKRALTPNEQSRVNSYLAVKNGTTLAENYLSTTSSVVWDRTINNGYNNNIFGISRDNSSALHQKQAASTGVNQKLVIGHGSSLFESNADNTNTLTEGQFLLTGDNGLKQSLSIPFVYTSGSNGETNFRFESVWKVQNTSSVGTITVAWPKGVNNLYLVQSADQTFATGNTYTPMATEVTVNGVVYNTTTATLADGQFFTFAGFAYAPGGVAGPDFWVKSDDAGDIATAWKDQSLNEDNIPNIGGMTLSPADRAHNFHPYTTDYTASKYFYNSTSVMNPLGNVELPNTNTSIFSAVRPTTNGTGRITGIDDDTNAAEPGMSIQGGFPRQYEFFAGTTGTNFSTTFNIGIPNVFSAIANNSVANEGTSTSSGGEKVLGLNGVYETTPYTGNRFQIYGTNLKVGHGGWDAAGAFPGDIMEVVWYNRLLTPNEQSRVNSYLAVKNGTTLNENYLSTTNNVVWDRTDNTGYNNNIFGIARDNVTALHQKQAASTGVNQKLVIGHGSSIFETNLDNTNALTEGQFLLTGDNGLKQGLKVPLIYTSGTNGETNLRFESVWKVQNSGNVGAVTVAWPKGIRNLYLVQSADQTFATGNTYTPMTTEVTVNGVVYNTATVTLSDGQFFTFAGFGQAPAGVVNSLSYWYRADKDVANTGAGTDVTSWTDFFSGTVVGQMGTNAFPKYAEGAANYFNFNPGVNFTAGTQTLGNVSVRTFSADSYDIFTFTKEGMASGGAFSSIFRSLVDNAFLTGGLRRWDGLGIQMNNGIERLSNTGGSTDTGVFTSPGAFSGTIPSIMYHTFTANSTTRALNGAANFGTTNHAGTGVRNLNGGHLFGDSQFGGNGSDNRGFIGHLGETIIYGAGNLSAEERRRVDSYMAIKYGITLGRVDTDHYLGSTASATSIVWDGADNTAYNKNIFGVARSDIGGFEQKVSKSVNTATMLTVATNDNYVLSNLDASRTSFTNDEAYILFGDNEATGETSLATDPCTGETLDPAVSTTNRVWRVQTTNASDAVWLQADLNAYNFNSDIEMWVADDENFTTSLVKVSAASYASGIATFNALFPEGVKYIKFVGVVTPSQCDVCTGGTFVFKTGRSWNTLAERTNNVIASETIGTTDQGDLIVDMDVADPANVEYGPTSTPRPYGRWMLSRRYDNQNVALTHTIDLNQAVAGASFQISNVNTYLNNANRFTIQGYDCDGNLVLPKITDAIANSAATTYEIQDNEVVGTKPYRGLASLYSTVNVRFDRVIQSIVIIQEVDRTNARNTLRSLNIGDISFECAVPLPPTEDNVTMIQDFTQSEDVPTCLETTMRMRFVNNNCDTRTVNISQTLPAGLEFVENTYNDSEFTTAPAYTYNANTFTLNGLELPSGTTYLYINVRSTAGTTTTYNTSSSFTVQETGNPYNSIDPAGNADSQVSFEASGYTAPALDVSYTVNATCLEEETPVTYTLNFDNQEASAITGATLNVYYALGQEISSVTLNNGITGVHGFGPAGESYIEMTNVTIPTGTSSIDVVMDITSDIFTDEPIASSVFQLITEPGNACSEESPIVSNVIELTECIFCATPTGIDSDGDGIDDGCDLDDDNDGILDIDEDCAYLAQNVSGAWQGQTTSTATVTTNGTLQTQTSNLNDFQNRYFVNQSGAGQWIDRIGEINHQISFSTPIPASEIALYLNDLSPSISTAFVNIQIVVNGGAANNAFTTTPLNSSPNYLNYNPSTGIVTSSGTNPQSLMLKGVGNTLISSLQIISSGISVSDRLYYSFYAKKICDTDGDGIPDHLDLDSDNDGCLDALEGDGGFTASDLEAAGGTVTVGFGSTALDENLCGDGTCVDANGIPTIAGAGQGIGSSQDASINNCSCYKPGLLTGGSILDTNIGITSLSRAGADNPDNWPMVRKGGWIALESKTKGFVVNRVEFTNADSDPLTPETPVGIPPADFVEGMMVYDNTNKCMKMYTSTDGGTTYAWYCITSQTCPD